MRKFSLKRSHLVIPYTLFLILFVVLPLLLIVFYAFTDKEGNLNIQNFIDFFVRGEKMPITRRKRTGR